MPDYEELPDNPDDELTEPRPRPNNLTESMNLDAIRATDNPEYNPDEDIPFDLPKVDDSVDSQPTFDRNNPHAMKTMPHFREPGTPDPKETLLGSGGLDPNPDMQAYNDPSNSARTVMNLPKAAPISQNTVPNPSLADARYQRPAPAPIPAPATQPAPQYQQMPAPPQQAAMGQKPAPFPRRRSRRRILGMPAGCVYMMLGLIVTFCGGFTLFTVGAALIFIPRIEEQWGSRVDAGVEDYRAFESTFYYDRYGNPLYEAFNEGRRDTVNYDRFPEYLIQATVAIEDDSFWSNLGVDVPATIIAATRYLGAGGSRVAGGSTITQQVVRNVLFDFEYRNEVSVTRKAEEIVMAVFLTQRRSKEEILELYLNEIYYGNLSYGAQAAAQTFFGKDVEDLTLGEAALLAGLPQAPANLDPLNPDPVVQDNVFARWRLVLNLMVEEGYITEAERDQTLRAGLTFVEPDANNLQAPHFTIYAQNEFETLMTGLGYDPAEIVRGGFRVYTTIDQNINNLALGAARTQVAGLSNQNVTNAAVVVMHPVSGQIIAMVGSVDYNSTTIDGRVNVTIALRQPGSTMKPFTYASGIELGMTAGDVMWDTPTEIGIAGQPMYVPRNYDGAFHGPMTMRRALANSYNIPAVQTLRLVGVDYLLNTMRRVGVTTLSADASQYGISLTLGGGEMSLLELTNAYSVFANLGSYVSATSILCVLDSDGNIIYQYEAGCPQGSNYVATTVDRRGFGTQVMDSRVAFLMTDILSDNVARTPVMGSRSALYTPNIGSAVKTGTTNDIKDNWTVGYTRNVAIGVWVGNNDGSPMVGSSGLTGAAPIWNSVMTSIYSQQGSLDVFRTDGQILPDIPQPPQGMSLQQICDVRSIASGSTGCPATVNEWFLDSPAAVPDGNGGLVYPEQFLNRPAEGNMQEISPDIYRVLAYPLNPAIAASLQFNQNAAGDLPPPAPRYCRVPAALDAQARAGGAQEFVFIAGPITSHNDRVRAETWAQSNNLNYLPTVECWDGVFVGGGSFGGTIVTAIISSPVAGQTIGNPIVIMGTVQFDGSQADFWHLDIIGGQFANWTPMGGPGFSPVVNGTLWTGDLPSGTYTVRLRLQKGGDFIQQPYEVSFSVP